MLRLSEKLVSSFSNTYEKTGIQKTSVGRAKGKIVYHDDRFLLPIKPETLLFATPDQALQTHAIERPFTLPSSGRSVFLRVRFGHRDKPTIWSAIQWKGTGNIRGMINKGNKTIEELAGESPDTHQLFATTTTAGGKIGKDPTEFGIPYLDDITEDGEKSKMLSEADIRTRELVTAAHFEAIPNHQGILVKLPETPQKGEGIFATRCPLTNTDLQYAIFSQEITDEVNLSDLDKMVAIIKNSLAVDQLKSAKILANQTENANSAEFLRQWLPWYAQVSGEELRKLHTLGSAPKGELHPQNLCPLVEFKDNSKLKIGEVSDLSENAKLVNVKEIMVELAVWVKTVQYLSEKTNLLPNFNLVRVSQNILQAFRQAYNNDELVKEAITTLRPHDIDARFIFKPQEWSNLNIYKDVVAAFQTANGSKQEVDS